MGLSGIVVLNNPARGMGSRPPALWTKCADMSIPPKAFHRVLDLKVRVLSTTRYLSFGVLSVCVLLQKLAPIKRLSRLRLMHQAAQSRGNGASA